MRVALRFLVMVMLLTVLSPKFGWESVSAAQAHIHTAGMAHDEMAGHETHDGCHQHDAAVNAPTTFPRSSAPMWRMSYRGRARYGG